MRCPITERDFQEQVLDFAHVYGWRVAHFRPAQTKYGWRTPVSADGKGFPDLCMVRKGRIIFAELKAENGKLTGDQRVWIEALRDMAKLNPGSIEVYVWHPADFDELQGILQ